MRLLPLAAALAIVAPAVAFAQDAQLTNTERAIVRAVDAHNASYLALLERLVNINSGTMNFGGVRQVGDVLRTELDSLGFTTRWIDGAPFGRAGHLVAERAGTGGAKAPKVLLIGHLDTVFEPSSPFQKFERLDDSTARGPGVIDMKGGDVIIVAALRALKDAGELDRLHVVVVYDGDEEEAGTPLVEARRALTDAAQGADVAIGFEDGAGDPHTLVTARRGDIGWRLHSTGIPAHSSQIFTPAIGAGAIYESARVLTEFYRTLSGEAYLTFNPGTIVGGTAAALDSAGVGSASGKTNVVAQAADVAGDLRTLSPEQLDHARRVMTAIVAHPLPGTKSEISFEDGYPPMAPTAGNQRLLALYDRVSQAIGSGTVVAVDPSRAGAADVSFIAGIVPMVVDAAGLSGHDDHSPSETADLRTLPVKTKRAAIVLSRIGRGALTSASGAAGAGASGTEGAKR